MANVYSQSKIVHKTYLFSIKSISFICIVANMQLSDNAGIRFLRVYL